MPVKTGFNMPLGHFEKHHSVVSKWPFSPLFLLEVGPSARTSGEMGRGAANRNDL